VPERIPWLVDEYVMKSETPERLLGIMKKAMHPDKVARSNEGRRRGAELREGSASCFAWRPLRLAPLLGYLHVY
jgi:hypothetical protein